jgi:hypothetical protein
MSRIYMVTDKAGHALRYVRANTLNGAVRAYALEIFEARPATAEHMWLEKVGPNEVLDALATPGDTSDPCPDDSDGDSPGELKFGSASTLTHHAADK